jgi:hypothetical protein
MQLRGRSMWRPGVRAERRPRRTVSSSRLLRVHAPRDLGPDRRARWPPPRGASVGGGARWDVGPCGDLRGTQRGSRRRRRMGDSDGDGHRVRRRRVDVAWQPRPRVMADPAARARSDRRHRSDRGDRGLLHRRRSDQRSANDGARNAARLRIERRWRASACCFPGSWRHHLGWALWRRCPPHARWRPCRSGHTGALVVRTVWVRRDQEGASRRPGRQRRSAPTARSLGRDRASTSRGHLARGAAAPPATRGWPLVSCRCSRSQTQVWRSAARIWPAMACSSSSASCC